MNENLKYNRRCPWCGRIAPPPAEFYFTARECVCCGNMYGWNWCIKAVISEFSGIAAIGVNLWLLINEYINLIIFFIIAAVIIIFYQSKFYVRTYRRIVDKNTENDKIITYRVKLYGDCCLKENMIYKMGLYENDCGIFVCAGKTIKSEKNKFIEMHTLPCESDKHFIKENKVSIFIDDLQVCIGEIVDIY